MDILNTVVRFFKAELLHRVISFVIFLVMAAVFASSIVAGIVLIGQDSGFFIGGGIGFVLAVLVGIGVSRQLPNAYELI